MKSKSSIIFTFLTSLVLLSRLLTNCGYRDLLSTNESTKEELQEKQYTDEENKTNTKEGLLSLEDEDRSTYTLELTNYLWKLQTSAAEQDSTDGSQYIVGVMNVLNDITRNINEDQTEIEQDSNAEETESSESEELNTRLNLFNLIDDTEEESYETTRALIDENYQVCIEKEADWGAKTAVILQESKEKKPSIPLKREIPHSIHEGVNLLQTWHAPVNDTNGQVDARCENNIDYSYFDEETESEKKTIIDQVVLSRKYSIGMGHKPFTKEVDLYLMATNEYKKLLEITDVDQNNQEENWEYHLSSIVFYYEIPFFLVRHVQVLRRRNGFPMQAENETNKEQRKVTVFSILMNQEDPLSITTTRDKQTNRVIKETVKGDVTVRKINYGTAKDEWYLKIKPGYSKINELHFNSASYSSFTPNSYITEDQDLTYFVGLDSKHHVLVRNSNTFYIEIIDYTKEISEDDHCSVTNAHFKTYIKDTQGESTNITIWKLSEKNGIKILTRGEIEVDFDINCTLRGTDD